MNRPTEQGSTEESFFLEGLIKDRGPGIKDSQTG